jgi:PKD repeat protein
MKNSTKLLAIIALIVVICSLIFFTGGFNTSITIRKENKSPSDITITTTISGYGVSHIKRISGPIFINATVARYSSTIPVYRGVFREGESVNKIFHDPRISQNVTTPEEAPELARKVLEPYGGLPSDAVSNGAFTQYSREYDPSLKQYVSQKPMSTTISYDQKMINGLWTIGDSNYIRVDFGENGELLRIVKEWRNYTYSGDAPIISLDTAIDKLERYELVKSDWHPEAGDITIDLISPGYYAKKISKNETILEPLWMFYGRNTTTGARLSFYVYARKFANFSATPAIASLSETITFIDTSEASPIQWYWDFGDGTNSTLRNPAHAYEKVGLYTVNLTVWNDMGSDTLSKTNFITIMPTNAPDSGSGQPAPVTSPGTITRTR